MKTVNLRDWIQFSERAYSRSYKSQDGKLMLKLATNEEAIISALKNEYRISKLANELGVPSPKVLDMVQADDGSLGVIYEYVPNKLSFSRAISQDPDNIEMYMESFAQVVKKFHSIEANTDILPSFESKMLSGLKRTHIFTEAEKERILSEYETLPKGTKCLHTDMQLSNAVFSKEGCYIIDLGLMCYGNPLIDVGTMYCLSHFLNEELTQALFHMNQETLLKCWKLYAKYYFDTENIDEVEAFIKPYAKVSCFGVLNILNDEDAISIINGKDYILS